MEANKLSNSSLDMLNHAYPQICRNIQVVSQQNHCSQNQKTYYGEKFEDSKNQVKTPRLNHCNLINGKQKIQETIIEEDLQNLHTKKQTNLPLDHMQLITENHKNGNQKNCQNSKTLSQQNTIKMNVLNNDPSNQSRKINYNNSKGCLKINFYYTKKQLVENQLLFIPQKTNIQHQKIVQLIKKQELNMFLKGQQPIFPIPDHVLKATSIQVMDGQTKSTIKVKELPMGFCQMLQLLNLSYLFPQKFKLEPETIDKLNQILQTTLLSKDEINIKNPYSTTARLNDLLSPTFTKYMKYLNCLLIEDLTSQKLQSLTNSYTYNVLSLAKFCQQNQLLEFVFQYNWPLITFELVKVHLDQSQDNLQSYKKSIIFVKNHISNLLHEMPQSFDDKFHLISLLIDCYSRTGSFRELFNKKTEITRNVNKTKVNLQEQKKSIELKIKKLISTSVKKHKKITKNATKKTKKLNNQQDSQEEDKNQYQSNKNTTLQQQNLQKLKVRLQQINEEIQKQNREDSLSACHYLGKDRYGQLYWYVTFFSDKLFIEKEKVWGCVGIQNIQQILQGLERRGIDENRLYQKVMEYYSSAIARHSTRMQIQTQENNLLIYKQTNLFNSSSTLVQKNGNSNSQQQKLQDDNDVIEDQNDSSKNSIENNQLLIGLGGFKIDKECLIRMIEVGEKKMTQYLKQRNSRWGSDENKNLLFTTLASSIPTWLEQAKKLITLFNQKICVVEIQYKVFVQQSVQQVDSKIKKIQTKIWGINEKHKHNWYDFINNCSSFTELFFAVSVLYSLIKKYTSKQRKLRKQYEEVKLKSVWKTTPANKQWKQQWNQQCEVCGTNGQVLCCDYCPKVYHLPCVNLTAVPETEFKCKSCKQQITTRNQFKLLSNSKKKHKK